MAPEDIQTVERRLGLKLPAGYIEFIARYPISLKELYYDFGTWREYLCDTAFIVTVERLIKINFDFRTQLHINQQDSNADFRGFLAIGHDPGFNFYAIDSNGFPTVYFYSMDDGWLFEIEANLDSFARSLEKSWEEWPHPKGKEARK